MKKEEIINEIIRQLDDRISFLKQSIQAAKESRDNETKSSVGDKYETGRAMVQMELEKNQVLLNKTETLKSSLTKIAIYKPSKQVEFGSFVQTAQGQYFVAIPFGKVEVNGSPVFCISMASPIGQILVGKRVGDRVNFQGKEIEIQEIR